MSLYDSLPVALVEQIEKNTNATGPVTSTSGKYTGLKVYFTGGKNKKLEEHITSHGGTISGSWSKTVNLLVIKNSTISNNKTKDAEKRGVRL